MLGAQESDRDEFKAIVDETVAELLENGADQETLAAVCQNRRFSVELSQRRSQPRIGFRGGCDNALGARRRRDRLSDGIRGL